MNSLAGRSTRDLHHTCCCRTCDRRRFKCGRAAREGILSDIYYFIYTFHMSAFFVLSGLLARPSVHRRNRYERITLFVETFIVGSNRRSQAVAWPRVTLRSRRAPIRATVDSSSSEKADISERSYASVSGRSPAKCRLSPHIACAAMERRKISACRSRAQRPSVARGCKPQEL
jgi:hypothetical protein